MSDIIPTLQSSGNNEEMKRWMLFCSRPIKPRLRCNHLPVGRPWGKGHWISDYGAYYISGTLFKNILQTDPRLLYLNNENILIGVKILQQIHELDKKALVNQCSVIVLLYRCVLLSITVHRKKKRKKKKLQVTTRASMSVSTWV